MERQDRLRVWAYLDSRSQTHIILFWLILIAVVIGFMSSFEDGRLDWRGLGGNLATELFGAAITFYIFDKVVERRDRETLQKQLIRRLASRANEVAKDAAEELRAEGWLEDGTLHHARLSGANLEGGNLNQSSLQGVNLSKANLRSALFLYADLHEAILELVDLQGANLSEANLQQAKLTGANLQAARMERANLAAAHLPGANLQTADLSMANLQQAILWQTNFAGANLTLVDFAGASLSGFTGSASLKGADLTGANLQNVELSEIEFDEQTTLPDGSKWGKGVDMRRFTDAHHPNFWRSDDFLSPAYA